MKVAFITLFIGSDAGAPGHQFFENQGEYWPANGCTKDTPCLAWKIKNKEWYRDTENHQTKS